VAIIAASTLSVISILCTIIIAICSNWNEYNEKVLPII
jgi:hypothetical protein